MLANQFERSGRAHRVVGFFVHASLGNFAQPLYHPIGAQFSAFGLLLTRISDHRRNLTVC